jgi:5-hydroxyisourate hydrolase
LLTRKRKAMERPDMAGLTTHILDTHGGRPAAGVAVSLRRIGPEGAETLTETVTNADGRTDAPLLTPEATRPGIYEIDFAIGPYFRERGVTLPEPAFLDVVTVRFGLSEVTRHYHVPLLASPYGYTTYRGS